MKKVNKNISFALRGIKTEEFAIIEESFISNKNYEIKYSLNTEFNIPKNSLRNITCLTMFKLSMNEQPFIKIKVSCLFEIAQESWDSVIISEDDNIIIPKNFADHIVVLTLGATRGVLHSKTEGTEFNKYYIPTINVAELNKGVDKITLKLN